MFKSFVHTAFRNLQKNKAFSFLNIFGLAIGIACASLILLWVQDELTFNHNYLNSNNLYTVYENQTYNGKVSTFRATPGPFAQAVVAEIPGIKAAARTNGEVTEPFSLGDKAINVPGSFADRELVRMLGLSFIYGESQQVLHNINEIVIDQSMAEKFFGGTDPVGKSIRFENKEDLKVTGVFKDLPLNSTFQFHWLIPLAKIDHKETWQTAWGANWLRTYIELGPNANLASINAKLEHYLVAKTGIKDFKTTCFLFAMNDWNLHNNFTDGKMDGGRITYVRLFTLIAWIILLIACINFMNLSTARSEQRAKEVGVRKVMGAGKGKLIGQFIAEALLMSFISVQVALGIIYVALPSFNLLVEKRLAVDLFQPLHIAYLFAIGTIVGVVAGSYPAFYLSSFNPIAVLKSIRIKSGAWSGFVRQGLVVMQFTASIILIIATIIIYQQIQHVKDRDLGFSKNSLIYVATQGNIVDHFAAINSELKQTGLVDNMALSDSPILEIGNNTDNYSWQGKETSHNPLINRENVNAQFIPTMGIKMAAGRNFYDDPKQDSTNVIINEAFAKEMGNEGRVGGILRDGDKKAFTIVGIMKDYLFNDMYTPGSPLLIYNQPKGTSILTIRLKDGLNPANTLAKVGNIIKKDNPGYPFDYTFVNDDFNRLFKIESLTGKLASVFAVLAVFISCLGLFGLAAYTAERRIKEIGIRKVLGASVTGLAGLLSKDFIKLVGIACLIAFPLAYVWIDKWLVGYQYRVDINWIIFLAAGLAAMLIALTTVSFQAVKAALMNPVKSLRSE